MCCVHMMDSLLHKGHYLTHEECKVNAKLDALMLGGCYAVAK